MPVALGSRRSRPRRCLGRAGSRSPRPLAAASLLLVSLALVRAACPSPGALMLHEPSAWHATSHPIPRLPEPPSRRRASRPPARHAHVPCRARLQRSRSLRILILEAVLHVGTTLQALGAGRARERARARPASRGEGARPIERRYRRYRHRRVFTVPKALRHRLARDPVWTTWVGTSR